MAARQSRIEVRLVEQEETLVVTNERSIIGGHHYVYVEALTNRPGQTFSPLEALRYARALESAALDAAAAADAEEADRDS